MYKRLFNIKYNNKEFAVFVDANHKYAFMEIKDGKLVHPELEDFKKLFEVFNVDNGILAYHLIGETLEEKIKYKGALLSLVFTANVLFPFSVGVEYRLTHDNTIEISQTKDSTIRFNSITDLNTYLGYRDISKEELFEAIDNNSSFNDRQREITKSIIEEKIRINPDIDLRLIYENLKDIKIEYRTEEELLDQFDETILGCYENFGNTIYLSSDDDFLFAHEVSHTMHNYMRNVDGKTLIKKASRSAFQECVTDEEANMGIDNKNNNSNEDNRMYKYLIAHADNFNYKIYDEYGLDPLIDELKAKYPSVDIEFIIDYFEAKHEANIKLDIPYISMFDNEEVIKQAFDIAKLSIDENDLFHELDLLMDLIGDNETLALKYSEKYYKYLIKKSFIDVNLNEVLALNNLVLKDNRLYLDNNSDGFKIPLSYKLKLIIMRDYCKGINIFDSNYLSNLVKNGNVLSNAIFEQNENSSEEEILGFMNLIFDYMLDDCSSLDELQKQYLKFIDDFNSIHINDSRYEKIWLKVIENDHYFEQYLQKCSNSNLLNGNKFSIAFIDSIVELDGKYYIAKSLDYTSLLSGGLGYYTDDFGRETEIASSPVKITYYDENFEEKEIVVNRGAYVKYQIRNAGKLKIQKYINDNNISNLSQESIKELMKGSDITDPTYPKAFTLSTGETFYDGELDNSIYIEFGKNDNGDITYQISKDDKALYKSCEDFVSLTSKISYKFFLDIISNYNRSDICMDELLNDGIKTGLHILEPLMKEIKVTWVKKLAPTFKRNENGTETVYSTTWHLDIDFINPVVVSIDGRICYARDVNISCSSNDTYLYINYPDGSRDIVLDLAGTDYFDYKNEYYFEYLEHYIDLYNLQPNEYGVIEFSKDQLQRLALDDFTDSYDTSMQK